ncbi:hypothetical protein WA158_005131 [Blastocystis sp. Blastoise]
MSSLDITEIETFLSQAKRENTKVLLTNELNRLKKLLSSNVESSSEPSVPIASPVQIKTATVSKSESFITVTSFSWDQDTKKVFIYLMDGFEGIGNVPKEQITSSFSNNSFELVIKGFNNKNYKFAQNNLFGEIDAEKSSVKIGKNRITIYLIKKDSNNWDSMNRTKPLLNPTMPGPSADPNAGLMDMMKQMYENGDDEMKRTITKAMFESQEKAKSGDLNMPDMPNMSGMSGMPGMPGMPPM